MYLAGVHRDDITGTCLDQPSATHGFLRATVDEADAKVFMKMAREGAGGIGHHRLDALRPAGQWLNE